jgi:ABC-2 type transport system ATP-binding protein
MPPAIEIRDLHYSYAEGHADVRDVLAGVDLVVDRQEIFGLLGPNGAGKSTTFRVLVGLAKPSKGLALLNGAAVSSGTRDVYRKVGYMPDLADVFDTSTLEGLLRFFGRCQGMSEERIEQRITELLAQFWLTDRRRDYLSTMSQGLKQQAHLMRCLLHDPEILILDEPASHLDPLRRQLLLEILRQEQDKGKTILISSHILPELSELCTSLAIMNKGRIVDKGRVTELKAKHQDRYATYRLRILSDVDQALRVAERLNDPNVRGLERRSEARESKTIRLTYSGSEENVANLIQMMVGAGVKVVEFSREYKEIEQIYRETVQARGQG